MAEELKPCPCCGEEAAFVELEDGGIVAVCASKGCVASGVARYACGDEPRPLIAETWNTRTVPAGNVLVTEDLLRRIERECRRESDWNCENVPAGTKAATTRAKKMLEIANDLRDLLSEQEGGKQ
ncbi:MULTISPECIES: Lar family restriction alleviation protein [Pseudomonas]|uniref:Lar family restriction alleviation protein n=1 Tax=Pseudomonas TaxID=286 RepID=UPI0021572A08|nr:MULTISPECIES: Lar family restriction alleviation protein [Pseudomonas]MCV0061499.1 Lar family restriction alleviation protein [Pseudomonas aeruginosa]HEJ5892298.1 Lar family restriction alleviation protein [Pseudomonas aeruginosa]